MANDSDITLGSDTDGAKVIQELLSKIVGGPTVLKDTPTSKQTQLINKQREYLAEKLNKTRDWVAWYLKPNSKMPIRVFIEMLSALECNLVVSPK